MNKQYDKWQDAVSDLATDKYDNDFKKIEGLKWLPWVGKNYDSTRIFVLGASHYEYIGPGEEESSTSNKFTRKVVAEHGIDSKNERHKKYAFAAFNKCLLNEKASSLEARVKLWSSVLFYNILQEVMTNGTDTIVEDNNALEAWKVFKKLVPILKPQLCIVWGVDILEHWADNYGEFIGKYTRKKEEGDIYSRNALITIDGHEVPICVIHHPSYRFFSREKWREYLLSQHKDKLNKIITG